MVGRADAERRRQRQLEVEALKEQALRNRELFFEVLEKHLRYCVRVMPQRFPYTEEQVPQVIQRLFSAVTQAVPSWNNPAFHLAMFELGIPYRQAQLLKFLRGES